MNGMMSLQQALQYLPSAALCGDGRVVFNRVHTDTRGIEPGDLFVALKGERYDASEFLAEAKAKGAVAAICHSAELLAKASLPGFAVSDTKQALGDLAAGWRTGFKLPLIAVTGSNGKTTVTQMIASILRSAQPERVLATQGNLNNDIGVPLTVLRLNARHEIAVVELGMNHPGEIARLAAIAKPTVALVNNAQREHLEFMATVEAVAHENGSVIASLPADGVAVFPAGDDYTPLWQALAASRAHLTFAIASARDRNTRADITCTTPTWAGEAWQVNADTPAGALAFELGVAGLHNVKNALAAIACTHAAGVPLAQISRGLRAFVPVKGRSRAIKGVINGHAYTLVDDTYNANPDSVRAAIEVLASLPGPRVLVLGDMGEVGEDGVQFHAEAGAYARALGIETLMTLGDLSATATAQFGSGRHLPDMQSLQAAVLAVLPATRSILVKGSRFMKMERVVEAITAQAQNKPEAACS
jgi:UDP-N-acetylmuramoyl-tripeptide--D-alanyl-D-alanine ligase